MTFQLNVQKSPDAHTIYNQPNVNDTRTNAAEKLIDSKAVAEAIEAKKENLATQIDSNIGQKPQIRGSSREADTPMMQKDLSSIEEKVEKQNNGEDGSSDAAVSNQSSQDMWAEKFDPAAAANATSTGMSLLFSEIIGVIIEEKQNERQNQIKNSNLSYDAALNSKEKSYEAAAKGQAHAVTNAVTAVGLTGGGALKNHGALKRSHNNETVIAPKKMKLETDAAKIRNEAVTTKGTSPLNESETKIISRSADRKEAEAAEIGQEMKRNTYLSQQQSNQASFLMNTANPLANATSSGFAAEQTEKLAEAQLKTADQQVLSSRSESNKREQEGSTQLEKKIREEWAQVVKSRDSNINGMIRG